MYITVIIVLLLLTSLLIIKFLEKTIEEFLIIFFLQTDF